MKKVAIIMGSDSDLPVAEKAAAKLEEFGVPYEVHIFSAHRTPDEAGSFARNARAAGFGVLIAAAGMAAHLAGALAANTTLLVHVDEALVEHTIHVQIPRLTAAHPGEVRPVRIKGVRQAHFGQDLLQLRDVAQENASHS